MKRRTIMEVGKVFKFKHDVNIGDIIYSAILTTDDILYTFWDKSGHIESDWIDFTKSEAEKYIEDGDWILVE
jgi:hypothetical protein